MNEYEFHTKIGSSSLSSTIGMICKILSNVDTVHPGGVPAKLVSSSPNDNNVDGTGIRKVILKYYRSDWTYGTEIITLEGLTEVDTIEQDIYRIESLDAYKVGSGNNAAGDITLKSASGSIFAQITAGRRIFERCLHYAERDTICVPISAIFSSSSSGGVVFEVFAAQDNSPDGNHIIYPYVSAEVKQSVTCINLEKFIHMDMTGAAHCLGIGITARGLADTQTGTATLLCRDFHVD